MKRLLSVIVLGLLLFGCQKVEDFSESQTVKETEFIMGTTVEITVKGEDKARARQAIEQAFREVKKIDNLMSSFKEDSEISRLNREGNQHPVKVSQDTFRVIRESLRLSELSNGAFDITIAPLLDLWGSSRKNKQLPNEQELKEVLPLVDYRNILLDEEQGTVKFNKEGMKIDLGGIAKGYAVDKAIEVLRREGIKRAIVNAGGDLCLLGRPPGKDFWAIGLKHPCKKGKILGIVKASDEAIATSGNYENYFAVGGKKYGHILNPHTGEPVEGVLSTTLIAKDALRADGLATAIFILGPEKGLELARRLEGMEAVIVSEDDNGKMVTSATDGLKDRLTLNP